MISREQLIAAGLHRSTIPRWVGAGHLHPIYRGVYAVGTPSISRDGRYMAAVLAGGEGAALAMASAARHLRLDRARSAGTVHLVLLRANKRSPQGILVHRPRTFEPRDRMVHFGIQTTTPTRTLFDLTPHVSANALRSLFERAEYLELLDRPRLNELVAACSSHKGIANLRTLANYEALPLSRIRSWLEGTILTTCRTHSLPLPLVNVPLLDYEVDFLWPEARFVAEADGGQHKGRQRDTDNARDVTLSRAGYLVRRYGEDAARDEAAVAREILEILEERSSRHSAASRIRPHGGRRS